MILTFTHISDNNECILETHNCSDSATCTNTDGSYTCSCKTGYTGDGMACSGRTAFHVSSHVISCCRRKFFFVYNQTLLLGKLSSFFSDEVFHLQSKWKKSTTYVLNIQNKTVSSSNFSLLAWQIFWIISFIVVSRGKTSVVIHYAPPNGRSIRTKRRQTMQQFLNNNPIINIFFQVIFEYTWYTAFALTVI